MLTCGRITILSIFIFILSSFAVHSTELPLFGRIEDYSKLQKKAAEQTIQPLKSTIDPDTYILGPMDEITVQVWKEPFETYVSLVNAEGVLIFEGIGSLAASGKSLSEARVDIVRLFSSKFRESVKITSCLSGLRPILVDVVGAVRVPGTYELVAQDRLIQALRKAGGLREFAALSGIEIHRNGGWKWWPSTGFWARQTRSLIRCSMRATGYSSRGSTGMSFLSARFTPGRCSPGRRSS